ncbi:MAG: YigZ family protein [Saprospiraceae bacterium]|nr:YigZ family protein [Saprospiraceae bacterium]
MMIRDTFLTLVAPSTGEYKEKGSKFLAYAKRIDHESEVALFLAEIRNMHPKARHFCYAWKIGTDNQRYRVNDDGEPSGTAGRPIYNQILSHQITNVMVVVVRYFGGTKLGVPGLIKAYKEATEAALSKAEIAEDYFMECYSLQFPYAAMGHIMDVIKSLELISHPPAFADDVTIRICIKLNDVPGTLLRLKAGILRVSPEEAEGINQLPECRIEKI